MRIVILLMLMLTSCIGSRARDHVGFPAIRFAWPDFRALCVLGDGDEDMIGGIDTAIEAGDRQMLPVRAMEVLEPSALVGVDVLLGEGEIGPNGAEQLRLEVRTFVSAYNTVVMPAGNPGWMF